MDRPPQSVVARRHVLYAGRFADRVPKKELPEGCLLLGDWDALPASLAAAAVDAATFVVADILSFPFEALAGEARDVPLVLVLPAGRDAAFLTAVFGETVFGRLDFFDRVVTEDVAVWDELRLRHGWAESQRVAASGADPARAAVEILDSLGDEDARTEKAAHRTRAAALLPRFVAARGVGTDETPLDVLHVGCGDGRWAGGFDPAGTRFSGTDRDEEEVALAGRNFPEAGFARLGPDLALPHDDEAFDLVFSTGVLGEHPVPEKETLLAEMWRVARPGGRLLFLEDFVGGGEAAPHAVSVNAFVATMMEATAGQVVLEHVQSVRYPDEDTVRGAVIGVSRLGVPQRW